MNRLLFAALTLVGTVIAARQSGAQGSGIISFSNIGTTDDRKIFVCEGIDVVRATGTAYQIALYWGQRGTPEAGLVQVGNPVGFLPFAPGQFSGGNRTVTYNNSSQNGDIVTVQARAWRQVPGVANTFEAVFAAGLVGDPRAQVGWGPVFDHDTSRPGDPTDPPYAIGAPVASYGNPNWRGFVVGPIFCPEPSTIALAILGGAASLLFVRRKSRSAK